MFCLVASPDSISIEDEHGTTLSSFDRVSMKELETSSSTNVKGDRYPFISILGVYKEDDSQYLVLIQEIEQVCQFRQIQRVKKIKVIQLSKHPNSPIFVSHIHSGFEQCPLFFSPSHDLTLTCQHELEHSPPRNEFIFNFIPLQQLKEVLPSLTMAQPVIGGFVQQVNNLVLISRHSRFNVGIHVWRRGADENGHVANFVETEEIAIEPPRLYSFVQVRGSCPLFWTQNPTGELTRPFRYGPERESHRRANKHLSDMEKEYGKDVVVCILTSRRGREKKITEEFEEIAKNRGLVCRQLDFNECMHREGAITEYIHKFDGDIEVCEINDGVIVRRQTKFVRSNCCSCLDRCNVFQAMLSGNALADHVNGNSGRSQMWIDHANELAREYAAAPGQKTSIQDAGKQSRISMIRDNINQAMRFVNSLMLEGRLDDSYSVVTQERKIKGYRPIGVLAWIWLLVSSLFVYVVIRLRKGADAANMYWRQQSRQIVCHPHYRDIRDADEFEDADFK